MPDKKGQTKSPEVEKFLNEMTEQVWGRKRDGSCCVCCGSTYVQDQHFRDDLSRKEFRISYMCQICQDNTFGYDPNESDEDYLEDHTKKEE